VRTGGVTVLDSCLRIVKRFPDGSVTTQRKRRPVRFTDDADCSWHETVPCPDHPRHNGGPVRGPRAVIPDKEDEQSQPY